MEKTRCNCCGKILKIEKNTVCEDFVRIKKSWGYFSKKDGITQEFVLCEQCIEKLVAGFTVPIEEYETKEMI